MGSIDIVQEVRNLDVMLDKRLKKDNDRPSVHCSFPPTRHAPGISGFG
jgi:hypothetical protein